jgi:hypothetical protein
MLLRSFKLHKNHENIPNLELVRQRISSIKYVTHTKLT